MKHIQAIFQDKERLRTLGAWLVSLGYVCISLWLLQPTYRISDDAGILLYSMEGFPIDYAGVAFTSLLHLAYSAAPDVPWYGLTLYAMNVLGVAIWLSLLWRAINPGWLAAIFSAVFLLCYLDFLVHLNYTDTSILLCMAALARACLDVMEKREERGRYLLSGIAFMLGTLARPQGALGSLAYILPMAVLALVYVLQEAPSKSVVLRRMALSALFFLIPSAVNQLYEVSYRHYNLTPVEARYESFNRLRGALDDMYWTRRRKLVKDASLLGSVGWSEKDAAVFFDWKFLDERVYTPDALETLVAHAPTDVSYPEIRDTVAGRFAFLWKDPLLLCSLPFFLLIGIRQRSLGALGVLLPVYCLTLTTFMYLYFNFLYRLEFPYTLSAGLAGLVAAAWLSQRIQVPERAYLAAALLAAILGAWAVCTLLPPVLEEPGATVLRVQHEAEKTAELDQDFKGAVILGQTNVGISLQFGDPLKVEHMDFQPIILGWNIFSPEFYREIAPLGISHGYELMGALVDRPDAYVLGTEAWCRDMLDVNKDTAGRAIGIVPVRRFEDGTSLFKLVSAKK